MTEPFLSPVLLFNMKTMKKEAQKKKRFSLKNRIAKFDNAVHVGLE